MEEGAFMHEELQEVSQASCACHLWESGKREVWEQGCSSAITI